MMSLAKAFALHETQYIEVLVSLVQLPQILPALIMEYLRITKHMTDKSLSYDMVHIITLCYWQTETLMMLSLFMYIQHLCVKWTHFYHIPNHLLLHR